MIIVDFSVENFFTNPQYLIDVTKTDLEGGDGLCTVICACLQKYTRQKRQQLRVDQAEEYINLRLYRVGISRDLIDTHHFISIRSKIRSMSHKWHKIINFIQKI